MKRLVWITIALSLFLTGCGSADSVEKEEITPAESVVQITEADELTYAETESTSPSTIPTEATEALATSDTIPTQAAIELVDETGTVIARSLNIRESPSINALKVGVLKYGAAVTIYEQKTINGIVWGRMEKGWVSMEYIQLGNAPQDIQKPAAVDKENEQASTEASKPSDPAKPQETTPPVTENTIPTVPPATENPTAPTDPQESQATEPTQQSEPSVPAVCQHKWVPIKNLPAEYEYHNFIVCSCGSSFNDTAAWAAHRDSYLGTEGLENHTGYSSSSTKEEITPARVTWMCSLCSTTKTINADSNP